MKLFIFLLLFCTSVIADPTPEQLVYEEHANYRANVIILLTKLARTENLILEELKKIRCKTPPIEQDCEDK
jgi:hypothetical protein